MVLCALAGASPRDPLTPAELWAMAKARDKALWDHTATLRATMLNIMRTGKDAIQPKDCHPYYADEQPRKKGLSHDEFVALVVAKNSKGRKADQ